MEIITWFIMISKTQAMIINVSHRRSIGEV